MPMSSSTSLSMTPMVTRSLMSTTSTLTTRTTGQTASTATLTRSQNLWISLSLICRLFKPEPEQFSIFNNKVLEVYDEETCMEMMRSYYEVNLSIILQPLKCVGHSFKLIAHLQGFRDCSNWLCYVCHGYDETKCNQFLGFLSRCLSMKRAQNFSQCKTPKTVFRFTTSKCLGLNVAVLSLAVSLTTRQTPTGYRLVLTEQKGEMFEEHLDIWVPLCNNSCYKFQLSDFVYRLQVSAHWTTF